MIATRSTCNTFHVLLFQPKSVVSKGISIQVKIQKVCWEKEEGQVVLVSKVDKLNSGIYYGHLKMRFHSVLFCF